MDTQQNSVLNFAFEGNLFRVVWQDDEPWFVAIDVCRALGIKDASMAVERLDDDEKGTSTIGTLGGEQNVIIVSEAGFYQLHVFLRTFARDDAATLRAAEGWGQELVDGVRKSPRHAWWPPPGQA